MKKEETEIIFEERNHLHLFRKKKLSYLYWESKEIFDRMRTRIQAFCHDQGIDLDYLKTRTKFWDEEKARLAVKVQDGMLFIRKSASAYAQDRAMYVFAFCCGAIIVIGISMKLFSGETQTSLVGALGGIFISLGFCYGAFKKWYSTLLKFGQW